ncbi:single-stranded-DNA-specific exonuclease RecJ [Desulfobulbus alkaliphilus]|uniref:single-stranded-DNA-specific exonuclease RecJ n=1 Tax=Desulfobulbus alkaliphilus TaxID=869814 RepID=UPI00196615C3|nr:single-stranded-DNA-specific exonuclease RecJ [Desulfobulbus alkaliphilus]MBM9537585.1 single-stranded-DNA-specific exonuclease RecJ [Desulfobulbus alkaliphilus]
MKSLPPALPYILPPRTNAAATRAFGSAAAAACNIPPQLAEILYQRGVATLGELQEFLYPQLAMLPDPATMQGMEQAIDCLLTSCAARKPVFIHGDYDVDGMTATALLVTFFREIGMQSVCWYIPNRFEEKYGLSKQSIDKLISLHEHSHGHGGVLITVDCGITAVEEVAYARSLGFRVIVTDHHEPHGQRPEADAILNPKQSGEAAHFSSLAGVGVAFFLIMALRRAMTTNGFSFGPTVPNLKKYLDLVALGTVADVVPLVGINRILVRAGLEVLSTKNRYGVSSLCDICGIGALPVQTEDIAYRLAPRLNAAGRLGQPHHGVNLLLATTSDQARDLTLVLEELNRERKQLEFETLEEVMEQCGTQIQAGWNGLSVYHAACHPGIVGILAARLVQRYGRPAIVLTDDATGGDGGNRLKGSGRSLPGTNLVDALQACSPLLDQFGGHAMAAGLTIARENLDAFAAAFQQQVTSMGGPVGEGAVKIQVDYHFENSSMLTEDFARAMQLLQPCGEGNPEPVFLMTSERLLQPRNVKGHLSFQVHSGGNGAAIRGIGFHLWRDSLDLRKPVDLVFHVKRSWYRGVEQHQLHALHIASC